MTPVRPRCDRATVSVIVPARNAASTIGATLEGLANQESDERLEIIVVDDGSDDATGDTVREWGDRVRLLRQGKGGPAAARNAGASAAAAEVLAFTDADCVPEPHWIAAGVAALEGAALVQGAVLPDPSASPGPFDRTLRVSRETGLYELANLFLHREWFERVGGLEAWLDQDAGKELAEDVWLGWRVRRAGGRTRFCAEAVVYHAVFRRGWRDFVMERRRLRYFPAIARKVPELRNHAFFARLFLTRRSASFDAAVVGALLAIGLRSRAPLLLVAPYLPLAASGVRPWRRADLRVAAVKLVADAVGLAALLRGSVRARTLVL